MRRTLQFLLVALLAPPALAQVAPTDILISRLGTDSGIEHHRADGSRIRGIDVGTGSYWEGAAVSPITGEIVTSRRNPIGINVFDPVTGAEVRTFDVTTNSGVLGDVAVFSDGTLAVAAQQDGTIELFTLTGTFVQTFAPPAMSHPFGIHIDARDHLWVCDLAADRVFEIDRVGTVLNRFNTPFDPADLILAPDGTLWIAGRSNHVVYNYTSAGSSISSFATNLPGFMDGIAMASDGTLWLTSEESSLLYNFDTSGAFLRSFPIDSTGFPMFITIGLDCDPTISSYCTAGTTSSGCHATMGASGTASLTNVSAFTLDCRNVEGNRNGIFFYGIAGRAASSWGIGGSSWLCVKSPTQRVKPTLNSGGLPGTCQGAYTVDWNAYVAANPNKPIHQALLPGTLVNAQAWFRDPASGTGPVGARGTALSDGLEFEVCP